jgi:3,4-dihydroxy-2-butanone 4-phosphate synthase
VAQGARELRYATTKRTLQEMLSKIEDAVSAIRRGDLVVVIDDPDRENEGDLILAAEKATPEALAFMVRHTSGVVCVSVPGARLDELELPLMVPNNTESHRTAFTVSVDYLHGTSTGISAADRAATLRALADPRTRAPDFARPGHVFPLRARPGGVLERPGHTEASAELAALAGQSPLGVLCEVVNDDGTMARAKDLDAFSRRHGLVMISIRDLITYRLGREAASVGKRPHRAALESMAHPLQTCAARTSS